jgi:hypothetical protein
VGIQGRATRHPRGVPTTRSHQNVGGKNSVSEKKLDKNDAELKLEEIFNWGSCQAGTAAPGKQFVGRGWLPYLCWLQPVVWCAKSPRPNIKREVQKEDGSINNNDGEAGAVFIGELMLNHILGGTTPGITTHLGSNNLSTISWNSCMATRATHKAPEWFLQFQACQLHTHCRENQFAWRFPVSFVRGRFSRHHQ